MHNHEILTFFVGLFSHKSLIIDPGPNLNE